jgi:hypothetical protein
MHKRRLVSTEDLDVLLLTLGVRCDEDFGHVLARWGTRTPVEEIGTSVIALAEIRRGIEFGTG